MRLVKSIVRKKSKSPANFKQKSKSSAYGSNKVKFDALGSKYGKSDATETKHVVAHLKISPSKRFGSKAQSFNDKLVITNLKKKFIAKQKEMFKKTPFGHFLNVYDIYFQTQLAQLVLLREVYHERADEEFALVIGLNCNDISDLTLFHTKKIAFKKKNIWSF
ncbi:uncharacterized protein LOC133818480 [Humulus lupulus]|uniref:uncharacterized protein LOC133818480 n=1 Tax=Humulus lupulus TaxID=3486 RepID=UPI002B40C791|nr:uncharacterized protein LOC133818480 [Humulus lupulus]